MSRLKSYNSVTTDDQQQIYMRSLNHYRTVLATKGYEYNRGHEKGREEGREEGVLTSARLMIAAGVDRKLVISTLKLTDEQIEDL